MCMLIISMMRLCMQRLRVCSPRRLFRVGTCCMCVIARVSCARPQPMQPLLCRSQYDKVVTCRLLLILSISVQAS